MQNNFIKVFSVPLAICTCSLYEIKHLSSAQKITKYTLSSFVSFFHVPSCANLINGPDESTAIYRRYKFFANEFTPVQKALLQKNNAGPRFGTIAYDLLCRSESKTRNKLRSLYVSAYMP